MTPPKIVIEFGPESAQIYDQLLAALPAVDAHKLPPFKVSIDAIDNWARSSHAMCYYGFIQHAEHEMVLQRALLALGMTLDAAITSAPSLRLVQ